MNADERERIRALEVTVDHMSATIETMAGKVNEMHATLMQARGARWALLAMAGAAGFLSGKLGAFFAAFLPK